MCCGLANTCGSLYATDDKHQTPAATGRVSPTQEAVTLSELENRMSVIQGEPNRRSGPMHSSNNWFLKGHYYPASSFNHLSVEEAQSLEKILHDEALTPKKRVDEFDRIVAELKEQRQGNIDLIHRGQIIGLAEFGTARPAGHSVPSYNENSLHFLNDQQKSQLAAILKDEKDSPKKRVELFDAKLAEFQKIHSLTK